MRKNVFAKVSAAGMSLFMLTGMLAGCGGKEAETTPAATTKAAETTVSGTSDAAETTTAAETTVPAEEVRITVPHWDSDVGIPYTQQLIDAFETANPGIKVDLLDSSSADYTNKLSIMLNGGDDLDVVWIKDGDTTAGLSDKGQLEDLTEYIAADNVDLSVYGGAADYFNYDGKQVALPVSTGYYVLFYNKDLFDAAGVEYPSNDMTWTEFEELAGKMTSGDGATKKYGAFIHSWQACVQNWAVQDGKNTIIADDYSFMKSAYEMTLRMQEGGSIMDYSVIKTGNIHYSSPFLEGNVAMLPMGTWFTTTLIDKINAGESTVNWGIATLPHPEDVEAGWTVGSTTPMGVNASSDNKDAAWKFVKFVAGEEGAKIHAAASQIPAIMNEDTISIFANLEGMPEDCEEALQYKNVVLDRPMEVLSAEINQMMGEEHSLIMIGELTIDEGLAEMAERSKEIQGK